MSIDPDLKFAPTWIALLLWVFWGLITSSLSLYSRGARTDRHVAREEVQRRGHDVPDVYYAELDTQGNLYVDLHDDLQHVPQEQKMSE